MADILSTQDTTLHDVNGNPVSVINDAGVLRLAVDTSGTLSIAPAQRSQNIFREATIAPIAANTWREMTRFTVPSGKKMLINLFQSLSASAGTRSALRVRKELAEYNFTTNTFTKLFNAETDRFFSNIDAIVTTNLSGSGNQVLTITYVNQDGVAGRTATITVIGGSIIDKRSVPMVLQGNDYGVKEITNTTEVSAITGIVKIVGYEQLLFSVESGANEVEGQPPSADLLVLADEIVVMEILSGSTTAVKRTVSLTYSLI